MSRSETNGQAAVLDSASIQTLQTLSHMGGQVEDSEGRATRRLYEGYSEPPFEDPKTFSGHLKTLEELGLLTRDIRGKRTYKVELTLAGMTATQQFNELIAQQGTNFTEVSNDQLIGEVLMRMDQAMTEDHTECVDTIEVKDTYIAVLEHIVKDMKGVMDELVTGNASWMHTAQQIHDILYGNEEEAAKED